MVKGKSGIIISFFFHTVNKGKRSFEISFSYKALSWFGTLLKLTNMGFNSIIDYQNTLQLRSE